ncbi:hypothetical protein CEXT_174501 [Caerostris extrusa]|uniref:Uncharacterized protein n=1 Tax=Caerostris extrusa TaxID=172846 RepID=A0AAV4XCL0_CAEEX|nr:hypothetical protein CEXT_174501 [Caerostris extrusa]
MGLPERLLLNRHLTLSLPIHKIKHLSKEEILRKKMELILVKADLYPEKHNKKEQTTELNILLKLRWLQENCFQCLQVQPRGIFFGKSDAKSVRNAALLFLEINNNRAQDALFRTVPVNIVLLLLFDYRELLLWNGFGAVEVRTVSAANEWLKKEIPQRKEQTSELNTLFKARRLQENCFNISKYHNQKEFSFGNQAQKSVLRNAASLFLEIKY